MDEGVRLSVGVAGHEVRGVGEEDHVPAVRGQGGEETPLVPLLPGGGDADPTRLSRRAVVNEDILRPVGVSSDEVSG